MKKNNYNSELKKIKSLQRRIENKISRLSESRPKYSGKVNNRQRHEFLLTFFEPSGGVIDLREENSTVEVNGFILRRYFSGNTKQLEVGIYTKNSYQKYLTYQRNNPDPQSLEGLKKAGEDVNH